MAETPRLDLPYLAASQAQKEIYHNVSLDRLDLLVQCAVLDRNLTTPPAGPALGDAYIVAATGTGAWAGHENHLALWVSSQWQFIAPLPGFQCWVRDEDVLVYWSGTAWTIVTGPAGGATSFLGLTDTPDTYSGQAGKVVQVNAGATALEFGTAGGGGGAPTDATYLVSTAHGSLSAERVITDSTDVTWNLATAGQVQAIIPANAIELSQIQEVLSGTLVGRSTTGTGDLESLGIGTGLELAGGILSATGGGGGSSTFLGLTDTPDSYSGQAGKAVLVNAGATALEFGTAGAGTFLALSDSPDSYSGQAGKGVTVNGAATGLEFTTAQTGSYDLGLTWPGTLPASQVLLRYPFPRAVDFPAGLTGSRGVAAVAATATTTLDLRKNGASVGSVQYAAGATTATFTMASVTSFAAGDVLTVHAPASADTTLADIGLSLAGTRAVAAGEMGATTFLGLTDTPDVYASNALKILRANAAETAVEFGPPLGTMATQNANAVAITGGSATGMTSVGIANSTPSYPLDVAGNVRLNGLVGVNTLPDAACVLHLAYNKASFFGMYVRQTGSDTGGGNPIIFQNVAATTIGSIGTNATATSYNTSSDVRLKFGVTALTGALEVVTTLRPIRFRWISTDEEDIGFLAHELMVQVPTAVSGLPHEVHPDGTIKPQQVDHSRLVPLLTAGIKDLLAQVEALTQRVSSLEEALGL